jgi:hypothetical protein
MYSPLEENRQVDPLADPAWLAFVESSPEATIFHHPAWLELLHRQYGYEMRACCVEGPSGIEAGIPIARISSPITGRRLVSVPFSDACPPLGANSSALEALATMLAKESEDSGLRLTVRAPVTGATICDRYVTHLLPLGSDPADVESGFGKSQGRATRKATREGLESERRTDTEALDEFYRLHLMTRRRLGVPTQPRRFIRRFGELFDEGLGFVWLIRDGGRPIAAAVFLTYGRTIVYKYGASDPAGLKKRPNNLLFLEVIRWACESGFETLDFGRTEIDNEGLRTFKRSWGAKEVDLLYSCLGGEEPEHQSESTTDRVLRATIQHTPPIVSRVIGEALYKHYG